MEFLNRIELRGIVGTSSVNRVGDAEVCRFSIVTEYSYKDRDNNPVVDTTWFNVTAWEGKNMPDFRQIGKGAIVQLAGRVRTFSSAMTIWAPRDWRRSRSNFPWGPQPARQASVSRSAPDIHRPFIVTGIFGVGRDRRRAPGS